MRLIITRLMLFLILSTSATLLFAQTSQKESSAEKFRGTWSGSFEGDSSGKFEMLLSPSGDGKHTGEMSITSGDGNGYQVKLKSLTFDGQKMVAKYDAPGGENGEVTIEGTLEGDAMSGSWSYHDQGNNTGRGTWKASRKAIPDK